jgi:hypothetical protein
MQALRRTADGRFRRVTIAGNRITYRFVMPRTLTARLPPRVEQKLAEYCARQGVTRTDALIRALDEYLDRHAGGAHSFALAVDLIPKRGARELQSSDVRKLARAAFRGSRSR